MTSGELHDRLRALIDAKGLSLADVARACGWKENHLRVVLTRLRTRRDEPITVQVDSVEKIAAAAGATLADVFAPAVVGETDRALMKRLLSALEDQRQTPSSAAPPASRTRRK